MALNRIEKQIVEMLATGRMRRNELRDRTIALGVSRATAYRAITSLEDQRVIKANGLYVARNPRCTDVNQAGPGYDNTWRIKKGGITFGRVVQVTENRLKRRETTGALSHPR